MKEYIEMIGIETRVKYKYQNLMLPEIESVIRNYLFSNPNKFDLYINDNVNVANLIHYIVNSDKLKDKLEILESDLLKVIIEYVEGLNEEIYRRTN